MRLLRYLRWLTVVGALILTVSTLLQWVTVTDPTSGQVTTTARPVALPMVGIALLLLAYVPADERWHRSIAIAQVLFGGVTGIIVLWLLLAAVIKHLNEGTAQLGPGPPVAFLGASIYVMGAFTFLQASVSEGVVKARYRLVGVVKAVQDKNVNLDDRNQF